MGTDVGSGGDTRWPSLPNSRSKNAKPGVHGDGAGLYLRVKPSKAKSWVLRVQHMGRREDIGLGGYPADLSLGEVREKAARLRKLARAGVDAWTEREGLRCASPHSLRLWRLRMRSCQREPVGPRRLRPISRNRSTIMSCRVLAIRAFRPDYSGALARLDREARASQEAPHSHHAGASVCQG